jgi:hypothetical protein
MNRTQYLAIALFFVCGTGLTACLTGETGLNLFDYAAWILIGISSWREK